MSTPIFAASAFIAASSPISVGSIRPSTAASTVPRSATSDSGQTTAVVMAGRLLAALDELVKDMVVGGMADQRINGNVFSQGCKIAHVNNLPTAQRIAAELHALIFARLESSACVKDHTPERCLTSW